MGGRSSGRSRSKNECIIPRCRFTCGGGHKRHAVGAHLPKLFWENSGSTSLPDEQMAQLLELVQFIASSAIGCSVGALTVGALQRHWRCSGLEARPVLPKFCRLGESSRVLCQSPEFHCTPVAMECRPVPCGYYGFGSAGQVPHMATFHTGARPGDGGRGRDTNLGGSGRGWVVDFDRGSGFGGGFCLCLGFCRGGCSRLGPDCAIRYGYYWGWKEVASEKKKKKKGGSKPQGAVSLADLKEGEFYHSSCGNDRPLSMLGPEATAICL